MFQSKLGNTYPIADTATYLSGSWWKEIDPIFAGRLAYLAQEKHCALSSNSAYRSSAEQGKLYAQALEYKRTGKGSIKSAAKPGTSKHEFRLAVDTSTQPVRGMTSAQLQKYGVHKPIASEGWHIEPIETKAADWKKYTPEEVPEDDREDEDDMKTYETIGELTGDWKEAVQWALEKKIILGNGKTLGLRESEVKALVFQYRDNKRKGTL
jgi:hypothetical protein